MTSLTGSKVILVLSALTKIFFANTALDLNATLASRGAGLAWVHRSATSNSNKT